MASTDPSLISESKEQKWVVGISEILNRQLEIEINFEATPISIFRVPQTITKLKPEAYEPQHLGFGPYHHFRAEPYSMMEQKKLAAVQRVMQYHKIKDIELTVLDKVKRLVPVVRACYDTFLQDDNISLAWVFTIDGLFLLNLFHTYDTELKDDSDTELEDDSDDSSKQYKKVDPTKRLLAQDIMMADNQIPFMILKEIDDALHVHPSSGNGFSPSVFRTFIQMHSPFELCSQSQAPTDHIQHLLHYTYDSIINNIPAPRLAGMSPGARMAAPRISKLLDFIKKVPEKEISQLYEEIIAILKNFSQNKTAIPSASKLVSRAGFKFHNLPKGEGIQRISINGKNFHLPSVTLSNDSEVILRNLVVYETSIPNSNTFRLTEYVNLLCGLVVNVDDVKILKKSGIIKGDLSENEMVKLFVGMSSSILLSMQNRDKYNMQEEIEEVNKAYESRPRMKLFLLLKKLASMLLVVLTAIGSFVGATWKIVAFMISIVTVFMLTYQAYCDVYGCDKTSVTSLLYASS